MIVFKEFSNTLYIEQSLSKLFLTVHVTVSLGSYCTFNWGQFHKRFLSHQLLKLFGKVQYKILFISSRGKWVDSLWPSDSKWRHISGSTLAQVMACCLPAPNHYLNQCWLIFSKVPWHSSEGIIIKDLKTPISKSKLKFSFLKLHPDLPGSNELTGTHLFLYTKQTWSLPRGPSLRLLDWSTVYTTCKKQAQLEWNYIKCKVLGLLRAKCDWPRPRTPLR